jgi:hypothetical protein
MKMMKNSKIGKKQMESTRASVGQKIVFVSNQVHYPIMLSMCLCWNNLYFVLLLVKADHNAHVRYDSYLSCADDPSDVSESYPHKFVINEYT